MNPVLVKGVLWVPRRAEGPGIIGDYMAPLDKSDPEFDEWLMEVRPLEGEPEWMVEDVPLTAAGWDESEHPRDPGGEDGGQFVESGAVDIDDAPVMGLGTPEQEATLRAKNAVPELVEQQMEADLKAFLDEADLQMRVPEEAMLEALDDGEFLNQHQAQNSRGMGRTVESEARMFGLPEGTPAEGLAKYGYLGPDHQGVISYGPIKVVFNDQVKDRATFTVNDSFMMAGEVIPSKVREPSYLSANVGQIDEAASQWAGELGVELDYGVGGMNMRYGSEEPFLPNGEMWHNAIANESTSIPYVEAQIYGKLTPADIKHVEVPRHEDWDLEDPLTGLPQIGDRGTMEAAISKLEDMGITVVEYEVPGDYSGEWA